MPVIGRLDKQVNDVLIEPVGKNRPREERDAPDDARRPATEEAERRDEEQSRGEGQLPVWLL
ncbi:MAG: hypothetical protein QOF61_1465 [Acidobacteriota bacterium]|jgi:hypothetical protein|nr:hypothetical protein [Acidobacteriota bacterium]